MKKIIIIAIIITIIILGIFSIQKVDNKKTSGLKIVASFYPMYILAENILDGASDVSLENMTNQNVGCLHDYTLQTSDLMKVENADVFIINGLGIENFISKILDTYKNIKVIEAGNKIDGKIDSEENAHIWLDIDKYKSQLENVSNELSRIDPENKDIYMQNTENYKAKLENLKTKINESRKKTKKCLSFSESLAHLKNTMNLEITTIETDHEQNGLSAEKMSSIIEYVKENNIKNIIIDRQTAKNNARTVASETGAKIYVLDSGLNGNGELNSYISMMENNLMIVESMEE